MTIDELRTEMHAEFKNVRTEMQDGFRAVRTETQAEFRNVRAESKAEDVTTRRHIDIVAEGTAHNTSRLNNHEPRLKRLERPRRR